MKTTFDKIGGGPAPHACTMQGFQSSNTGARSETVALH